MMEGTANRREQRIRNMGRKFRTENKCIENANKPALVSNDVLKSSDFTFSKSFGIERVGDSGELLLAKSKQNKMEQYIVKHEYTDCACNEFVYYKLANFLGIKTPAVKLFEIVAGEKRKYFKTEFVAGIEYLNIIKENFSVANEEQVKNPQDYFKFKALYDMFSEEDSFEVVLDEQGYIYKIDNTAAFNLSNYYLDNVGIEFPPDVLPDSKEYMRKALMKLSKIDVDVSFYTKKFTQIRQSHGEVAAQYYLEPFRKIIEMPACYVDEFLMVLCYFYADIVGDYYKAYIKNCKEKSSEFLNALRR